MDVSVPAWQRRGSSMRTAGPGSSHCGRTPGSPTARPSRRLTCRRVGLDGTGGGLRPSVSGLVQSVTVVDDRTLAITLRSQRVDVPQALAHPDLAIAKPVADSQWPLGTRSSRIATEGHPAAARAATVITVDRDNLPAIRFLVAAGDTRDLLDQGVDLLLTRDPATLEYAATLPQFRSVPLAWQQTRILLAPGRSRSAASLSDDARQVLADDAVRGEARGARGPFWWQMMTDCEVTPSPPRDHSRPIPRIVYDASDGAARDLAERFVGLVRASGPAATAFLDALLPDRPGRTYQRATGLTGEALAQAQRRGADAGYVTSVDSRPVDPCRDLQALMDSARWLDPETIVPLVETRLQAIVRRGRSRSDRGMGWGIGNRSGKRPEIRDEPAHPPAPRLCCRRADPDCAAGVRTSSGDDQTSLGGVPAACRRCRRDYSRRSRSRKCGDRGAARVARERAAERQQVSPGGGCRRRVGTELSARLRGHGDASHWSLDASDSG